MTICAFFELHINNYVWCHPYMLSSLCNMNGPLHYSLFICYFRSQPLFNVFGGWWKSRSFSELLPNVNVNTLTCESGLIKHFDLLETLFSNSVREPYHDDDAFMYFLFQNFIDIDILSKSSSASDQDSQVPTNGLLDKGVAFS